MSEWTPLQRAFVEEYLKDLSGAKAARRAGYAPENARSQAAENLAKPHIRQAIADALEERAKACGFSSKRVLLDLIDVNDADLADIHDEEGRLLPIDEWPAAWRRGLVVGMESEEHYETETDPETGQKERVFTHVTRKLKLADRQKNRELLGRHVDVQAFREQVKVSASEEMIRAMAAIGARNFKPQDDGRG